MHATISISIANPSQEEALLAWSNSNIERDEHRTRLANSVVTYLHEEDKGFLVKHYLDEFCYGLWAEHLTNYMPEDMAGAEEARGPLFLLRPYIVYGAGTILFAAPGRGKSYIGIIMAVSIDAGIRQFWPVESARVLFINLERSADSVKQRLGNINEVLGLPRTRKLLTLNAKGRRLEEVAESAKVMIQKRGVHLVILDSISRAGFGDLNENRPVNSIIDCLNDLCPTWAALAHTPRKDEEHIFGGIHFEAGADIVVQILSQQSQNGTLGLGLQITKANDISTRYSLDMFALEFGELGLTQIRPAKQYEFPDIMTKRKVSLLEEVTEYLLENTMASATEIANDLGRGRPKISLLLSQHPSFTIVKKEKRNVLYGLKSNEP